MLWGRGGKPTDKKPTVVDPCHAMPCPAPISPPGPIKTHVDVRHHHLVARREGPLRLLLLFARQRRAVHLACFALLGWVLPPGARSICLCANARIWIHRLDRAPKKGAKGPGGSSKQAASSAGYAPTQGESDESESTTQHHPPLNQIRGLIHPKKGNEGTIDRSIDMHTRTFSFVTSFFRGFRLHTTGAAPFLSAVGKDRIVFEKRTEGP